MTALCYPYGGGITCVCDTVGKIFKCFPHLGGDQAEHKTALSTEEYQHLNNSDVLDRR